MLGLKSAPALRTSIYSFGLILIALFGFAGKAYSQCGSPANAIVAENCLTGSPSSEWDVGENSSGDSTIQGFGTDISVNQGGTIGFKISTPARAYTITIYRLGYYGGMGARKIATVTPSVSLPQTQPACLGDTSTGLMDCGNWALSASWQVPATATSGIYFAHLVRSDTGGDSQIVFVVRNDASHSNVLFQTSDETWQAYNYYGAGSLYGQASPVFNLNNRSYKVSYNRPFLTRGFQEESDTYLFGAEFAMVQWLEANGYDVSYFTSVDAARSGSLIQNHKIFMDTGHDEYWSGPRHDNVVAARDAGVNLAFFTGNEVFWKTRWENSIDGTSTPYRTLVCYKETLSFSKTDPSPTWTGTWRDPSFSPPSDGGRPENGLTGTIFVVNGTGPDNAGDQKITVPAADGKMRFWRNTAAATLAPGASYTMPIGTLGYEWDIDADNGFRPAGAFPLSTSTYTLTSDYLLDYGATYGAGVATHHLMTYRAPSGALVFGAGTINWSWGLNSNHDNPFSFDTPAPDKNMQQATVNLFADMGVQPGTLQSGLVPATASTDQTAPTSTIVSPAAGAAVSTGNSITVSGTATDTGGVVGGVEVSTDNGATWHPATGRGAWSYSWTPSVVGAQTLLSRAVDDSANLETPNDATLVHVAPQTCPCSIWNASRAPNTPDAGDGNSVEVGVKFRADANGSVIGVRFYKSTANTGTHVGHIWTSAGNLLGTATFTGESSTGWQQAYFSTPVPIVANTTYVISYFAPKGHYAADAYYFATAGADNPPLHALATGVDGQNGLFLYNSTGGFPTSSYIASNYWVDVLFTSSNTYNITGTISGYGGGGSTVALSGTETATVTADSSGNYAFNGIVDGNYTIVPSNPGVTFTPASQSVAIQDASVSGVNFAAVVSQPLSISGVITGGPGATVNLGGAVTASTTADQSGNYSFQGLLGGTYSVTPVLASVLFTPGTQSVVLSGTNATGVNFQGQVCNCTSIWQPSASPTLIDANEGIPIELGVKFRVDAPGLIDGLRFYKSAANTGTHVGHIWASNGTLLGTATFSSETASGWQQVNFAAPIQVSANTTYVASYFAPVGHYSADTNFFATSGVDSPPLHALANGVDGANGVYIYTSSGAFPNNTYASTNYWVDVLYSPASSYSLSGTISGGGGATVALAGSALAPVTADSSGNYVFNRVYSGSYSVVPASPGLVFSPGNQNVVVGTSPVTGVNFTVPALCPCQTVWAPATLPLLVDSGDPLSYELGMKFRADFDGYILGVRFYKAPTNTGIHIGNLWSSSNLGSPIGSSVFANESNSGWQQVLFNNPVPVTAKTTYIGSYFSPSGHYSVDAGFFGSGVDNAPLHALADGVDGSNGVYANSSMSSFPSTSYQADNYWVDVIYSTTSTHSLGGQISGLSVSGVTLSLSGAATATTTTDAYGNYSFSGLADGTYTVTPSNPNFVVTPASQTTAVSGAHNLNVNFTSALPTYAVSGAVAGAPGISVALTGTVTTTASTLNVTVTADSAGNYTFPAVPSGSYKVIPSNLGYVVTPVNQSVVVNGAPVGNVNFSAVILTYTVSGTITGGAGATVSLAGPSTMTTTADTSGNFSFGGVTVGSYSVTPSLAGNAFTPGNTTVAVTNSNISGLSFQALTTCPCTTIWQPSAAPTLIDSGDVHAVELGVKFRVDADGYIAGLRYYKASANTGTHIGHLWSSNGTLLGTATFTSEGNNGWQQVLFASPVPVAANTTYVASYFAPIGHYAADTGFFQAAGVDSPPLHALGNGVDGLNGVYFYGAGGGFPNASSNSANYWVDVIYTATTTYSVTGTITGAGGPGATVALSGTATGTVTADASGNFAFAGLANGPYVVKPSQSGFRYSPSTQTATINSAHVLGLSFATASTYSITGTISGTGGAGASVSLTGDSTATTTADGSGNYAFPGLVNGSYAIAVSAAGYVFTPASQSVALSGANSTANFSSALAPTYTISGTISGSGGPGAQVTLGGAASASTTASSTGSYSFAGLAPGAYTVAPANGTSVFSPASASVTVSTANQTANFTTVSYSLSGTVTGPGAASGATVTLTGASSASATLSPAGTFSFTNLVNGSYTVALSKTGYNFNPASQSVTINGANANLTFTSTAPMYTISGTISGAGGPGAIVALSGSSSAATTANSSGVYSFAGVLAGSYTVQPVNGNYVFSPASQAVTVTTANKTANFATVTYSISGTISGPGASNALVTLTGPSNGTLRTTASGAFTFSSCNNGTYSITVSNAGYAFTPTSQNVTVSGANATVSFTSGKAYTISGTISGNGGPGATVSLSGAASASTTANSSGNYTFANLLPGSYLVQPSNANYTFTPATRSVTISNANQTASFSTATYTITGTITGPAASTGVSVALSGTSSGTTTANSSGVFTFTNRTNGSYTISVNKTGYVFTPGSSQAVTVSGANATVSFGSSVATYSISGTITGLGGPGATVTVSGQASARTTADSSGNYTITGLANGLYSVAPSKAGRTYTPSSRLLLVNGANVGGVSFSSR